MKTIKLSDKKSANIALKNKKAVTIKAVSSNNLLAEGSFENTTKTRLVYTYNDEKWYGGFEGFEGFKTYADISDEMAHSGKQSLKADFRNRILMKRVEVEKDTDYIFSFYYYFKSDAESHKTPLWNFVSVGSPNIRFTVCNGEWWMGKNMVMDYYDGHRDDGIKTVHDRWQRVDVEFNSKNYDKVSIGLQYSAADFETPAIFIDDMSLYKKELVASGEVSLDTLGGVVIEKVTANTKNGLAMEYSVEVDKEKLLLDFDNANIEELGVLAGYEDELCGALSLDNKNAKSVVINGSETVSFEGISDEDLSRKLIVRGYAKIKADGAIKTFYSYETACLPVEVLMQNINDTVIDEQFVEDTEIIEKVTDIATKSSVVNNLPIYNDKGVYGEIFSPMNTGIYHLMAYMDDECDRKYTETEVQIEMDRLKDSGITAVRSMFRSTYACPEGEFTGWDWNSPTMQAMYKAAEELKKRNIDVMLTCGWLIEYFAPDKFPAVWYKDHTYLRGEGPDFYGESDGEDFSGMNEHQIRIRKAALRYGEWVSQGFKAFWERGYDNVKYAICFTEPAWNIRDDEEECDAYVKMIVGLNEKLNKYGIREKITIIGPNQSCCECHKRDKLLLEYVLKNLPDKKMIDIYSTHTGHQWTVHNHLDYTNHPDYSYNYLDKAFKSLNDCLADNGVNPQIFSDELFAGTLYFDKDMRRWHAPQIMTAAVAGIKNKILGFCYWSIYDQQWPNSHSETVEMSDGIHCTGTAPSLLRSYTPHSTYYGISLYSRYAKDLDKTIETDFRVGKDLFYCMLTNDKGVKTVMVTNMGESAKAINLQFGAPLKEKLYRHTYAGLDLKPDDRARLAGIDKEFYVEKELRDVIPPCSVMIYTTRND